MSGLDLPGIYLHAAIKAVLPLAAMMVTVLSDNGMRMAALSFDVRWKA
jgi:hypothetical protein